MHVTTYDNEITRITSYEVVYLLCGNRYYGNRFFGNGYYGNGCHVRPSGSLSCV